MGFPSFHVNKSLIEVQARPGQTRQEAPLAFGEIGGFIWSSSVVKVTNMMKTEYPTISCNQIRQTRGGRGGGEESCAHSFNNFCEYRSTPKSSYLATRNSGGWGRVGWGRVPGFCFPYSGVVSGRQYRIELLLWWNTPDLSEYPTLAGHPHHQNDIPKHPTLKQHPHRQSAHSGTPFWEPN
jgi:hypothetical protein